MIGQELCYQVIRDCIATTDLGMEHDLLMTEIGSSFNLVKPHPLYGHVFFIFTMDYL